MLHNDLIIYSPVVQGSLVRRPSEQVAQVKLTCGSPSALSTAYDLLFFLHCSGNMDIKIK